MMRSKHRKQGDGRIQAGDNLHDSQHDSAYYDGIADGYNELHSAEQERKYRLIFSRLHLGKDDTILDVGCGTGLLFSYLHERLDHPAKSCFGIDPSKRLLEKADRDFAANVKNASGEDIPFKDHSFDVVVSITCLQNMRDPGKAASEMRRVGKRRFAISFLKKSAKAGQLAKILEREFPSAAIVEEEKDIIFIVQ